MVLYAAGDTSTTDAMAGFAARKLDWALLPIDGVYNMGSEEASRAAELISAVHSVPLHMMPGALFGAMYAASPVYARTCRPQDVFAQMTIRRRTLFYIDVMARGEYPVWQADFFKDNGVELVTEPGDKEILNQGTIDYISFSMYRSTTCTADSELKMNVLSFDPNPYLEATPWGWTIDPLGLR